MTDSGPEITRGLPALHRAAAATLYYEAFEQKLARLLGPPDHAVAALAESLNPDMCYVATAQGRLLGLAGFQWDSEHFVDPTLSGFCRTYGLLIGPLRLGALALLGRRSESGELLMDGLVVAAQARGRGLGSRLLDAVATHARSVGSSAVRLDVVDTNPNARRLYERRGFTAVRTTSVPVLGPLLGFRASTTMRRPVSDSDDARGGQP
ncbi:MAG: GNAT family N-acetyltransferase [Bacteroidota bacterium]